MTTEQKARTIRMAEKSDLEWAAARIGVGGFRDDAKGIVLERHGVVVAVVVYDTWSDTDCHMHLASDGSKRWMTREYLLEAFYYPFVTAGRRRVTGIVDEKNVPALALDLHLGFVVEGKAADATPDGDAFLLGLTRRNCRFIPREWRT